MIAKNQSLGFFLVLLALVAAPLLINFADYDLFARLAVGKLISETQQIPIRDVFSFTPTKKIWHDHEWLSGVVFYQLYIYAGEAGIILFNLFLLSLTALLLFLAQDKQFSLKTRITWLTFCLIPCLYIWNSPVRAQAFTFLFFALGFYFLSNAARRKYLWLMIPCMILWVNLHAGFLMWLITLSVFILIRIYERKSFIFELAILFFSILAILINPYGFSYVEFLISAWLKNRSLITEWQGLELFSYKNILLYALTGIFINEYLSRKESLKPFQIISALLFLASAFYSQRLIAFYLFILAVYFVPKVDSKHARFIEQGGYVSIFIFSFLGIISILRFSIYKESRELDKRHLPVAAMDYLESISATGRLLTHFDEGSYALWRGYPNLLVSLDGRYEEVYEDSVVEEILSFYSGSLEQARVVVDKYKPEWVLVCGGGVERRDIRDLGEKWLVVYRDDNCEVGKSG